MDINVVKISLMVQFGQNRSFLVKMVKIGSFLHNLGVKMSKFWESDPINLSLEVSKNHLRFMDRNVV